MSSTTNDAQVASARQTVKALNIQRQSLELESAAIISELTAVDPANPAAPPIGIDTPLTDGEGFPRNDIDVYRARTQRGRLATIKTDHKRLMGEIEVHLKQIASLQKPEQSELEQEEIAARLAQKPKPKYDPVTGKWVVRNWDGTIAGAGKASENRSFDNLSHDRPSTVAGASVLGTTMPASTALPMEVDESADSTNVIASSIVHRAASSTNPMARVESVASASPAASAGLQTNDAILAFGPITESLHDISDLVRSAAADQVVIELRVLRGSDVNDSILLQLKPRPWNGRGLLGCHIVPV
jgi:26S proteasome regulatory subunit N4